MTHVSKRKIKSDVDSRITKAFANALFSTSTNRGKARIHALLTPTERLMLAKRLAIITMLERDSSYYDIECALNVSGSTVKRLHGQLLSGDFDPLVRIFGRNLSFLDYLELFLAAGMPSVAGPRHQKRLNRLRAGAHLRHRRNK